MVDDEMWVDCDIMMKLETNEANQSGLLLGVIDKMTCSFNRTVAHYDHVLLVNS